MEQPPIFGFRLRNFKAVQDSGEIDFTPLTVFVGNNGSGKSSLIEGLEMLQNIVDLGLDRAMEQWRGFEHIWNKTVPHELPPSPGAAPDEDIALNGRKVADSENVDDDFDIIEDSDTDPSDFILPDDTLEQEEPNLLGNAMEFWLRSIPSENGFGYTANVQITSTKNYNKLVIKREHTTMGDFLDIHRDAQNRVTTQNQSGLPPAPAKEVPPDELELDSVLRKFISSWQFLVLNPQAMSSPKLQKRTGGKIRLSKDGSNIAEYLLAIREDDSNAFNGIVETLQYVLPYAEDLQPTLTSELERNVYLNLKEGTSNIPGWLLSTGTLRILAILAVLRHPQPPPVLVIEELENGLDPRTLHLVVEEIQSATEYGNTQVIITTHSPYLLDLLDLSQIIVVERLDGQPSFVRPVNQASLQEWSKDFGPGKLYTMNRLGKGN